MGTIVFFSLLLIPEVFAANSEVTIVTTMGSGAPGCEETVDGCFIPGMATVDLGGKVIFLNTDSAAHTVTSGTPADGPDGNFDSSLFMAGSTFSVTLDESGEYPYFCMVHPWMTGIIIVEESTLPPTTSNSLCGVGTVFDEKMNACILVGVVTEKEDITNPPLDEDVEEIFEFNIRRDTYVAKEPIFIDGYIKYKTYPSHINIKISEKNGQLVENVYLSPSKDDYFFYNTKSLPFWEIPMTYAVTVSYGGESLTKYFDLINTSKDYDPQSVESLQTKLAKANIKNHSLLQKIEELEKLLIQKEKEKENMACYKEFS